MATRNIKTPGEQAPEETTEAVQPEAQQPSALPHVADIDPTKLTKSVLTQSGWVCPA